jgi:hypothetical protein
MDSKNISKKSLKFNTAALWQNYCAFCAISVKKTVKISVHLWLKKSRHPV